MHMKGVFYYVNESTYNPERVNFMVMYLPEKVVLFKFVNFLLHLNC